MSDHYNADTMLPARRHYALRAVRIAQARQRAIVGANRRTVDALLDSNNGDAAILAYAEAETGEAVVTALEALWAIMYDVEAARTTGEERDTDRARLDASCRAIDDEIRALHHNGTRDLIDLHY